MKILHTADIHLRTAGDERWRALRTIINVADTEGAGLVVISGDMFDRGVDAHTLKVPIRELLQECRAKIVILPGNHDALALAAGDYYGANVHVLADADGHVDTEDVRVFGLPFEKIGGEKVIERLLSIRGRRRTDATNILLYHGELLDVLFVRGVFGEEEETGYMPVPLSAFDESGIDYVLAGHFHSNFDARQYRGGYFVYPGSPVSITRKETGVRRVNLFETGDPPRPFAIESRYYEDVVVTLSPFAGAGKDPLGTIEQRIAACAPNAHVLLTVTGMVDLTTLEMTEEQFAEAVAALSDVRVEMVAERWLDVSTVRDSELFVRFMEKLERASLPEAQKEAIRDMTLESMMEAIHAA
jgi:DNA repair exonuclease SbcCD nuclease subunit